MTARAEVDRKEGRVRVPGTELHVLEAGEGEPLLLLHGWPQDGSMWDPLVADLAQEWRVLVPDLRGFGRSEAPRGDYSKHALADDILGLLDVEGIERATVVGHDWGGWIAWLLALEHPDRVERFASLDIPPPWRSTFSPGRLPLSILFGFYQYAIASPLVGERLVSSPRTVSAFIRAGSGSGNRISAEAADGYARLIARRDRAHASVALYRTFLLKELPQVLRGNYTEDELTVPGLVIMGGESGITKAFGAPDPRDNLRVEFIPQAGHFLVDEAPREVLDLLCPFLAKGQVTPV
jgi:pimeloyl-ACP methyl ester carboxylesterase